MLLKVDGKVKKVKKVVSKLTFNRPRRRRSNIEYGDTTIGGRDDAVNAFHSDAGVNTIGG